MFLFIIQFFFKSFLAISLLTENPKDLRMLFELVHQFSRKWNNRNTTSCCRKNYSNLVKIIKCCKIITKCFINCFSFNNFSNKKIFYFIDFIVSKLYSIIIPISPIFVSLSISIRRMVQDYFKNVLKFVWWI